MCVESQDELKILLANSFENRFRSTRIGPPHINLQSFSKLNDTNFEPLTNAVTDEEVIAALKDIDPNFSPG